MTEERKSEIERLSSLFEDLSPELERKVAAKMIIAAKIDDARKQLSFSKLDLAKKFKKNPSEMTKWLSGNHNFTVDTLIEIERVLNIKLLSLDEKQEIRAVQYVAESEKFIMMVPRILDYCEDLDILVSNPPTMFNKPKKMHNLVQHVEK